MKRAPKRPKKNNKVPEVFLQLMQRESDVLEKCSWHCWHNLELGLNPRDIAQVFDSLVSVAE